jgi:hypothetical protein
VSFSSDHHTTNKLTVALLIIFLTLATSPGIIFPVLGCSDKKDVNKKFYLRRGEGDSNNAAGRIFFLESADL